MKFVNVTLYSQRCFGDVIKAINLEMGRIAWIIEFNSDDHYIHYCGQESLRRNGVVIIVNKRVQNADLDAISKLTE